MKKILSLLISASIFLSVISGFNLPAYAFYNPYPGDSNTNCTYYVWQRTYDKLGIILPAWGNAKTWYSTAKSTGYQTSSKPSANWIAVWDGRKGESRGHVAFVESVDANKMTVSEGGYNKINTRTISVTADNKGGKLIGFFNPDKKAASITCKATGISKLTAKSKAFTVKWKKPSDQITGYQIQYSTDNKFSNAKTVTVSKSTTTSKTISKLKAKKKYYVRIRTYKKVNGKKYYSSWSKAKSVTTKK
ncbi:MAG: CHAP domain-containing protein [Eubacterium sp.]